MPENTIKEIKMSQEAIEYGIGVAEQIREIDEALSLLCLPYMEIGGKRIHVSAKDKI